MDLIQGAIFGAVFGFGTAITGIAKNRNKPDYEFDPVKAATTIAITTLAGAYMGVQNMPFTNESIGVIVSGFASVGITEWVSNAIKSIWRHLQR